MFMYIIGMLSDIFIMYGSCYNLIFYPLFLYILQKKKHRKYVFSVNLVILLSLFNFYVLKNLENH
jgi:hypothetical protein